MTDAQLTTLSTILWLVGTCTLFVLLAHWSAGGSWGISSAIARGLTGWSGRKATPAGEWPSDDELGPIGSPRIERLWSAGAEPSRRARAAPEVQPISEMEDLGSRHLQ